MARAYFGRRAYPGLAKTYAVDSDSALFLNLYQCTGANFTRVGSKGHQYCFPRENNPLERLRCVCVAVCAVASCLMSLTPQRRVWIYDAQD